MLTSIRNPRIPTTFRLPRKYPAMTALALLGAVLAVPLPALAHSQPHPGLFALPASTFPVGSQVVRAGVESNRQLLGDEATHFGVPPRALGRRTGYYMDAIEGDPAIQPHPYTSYLVSIFHSARQAQRAYDYVWDSWFAAAYYTSPSPAPIRLGQHGEEALFHTLDPSQPPLTELFFVRGAILVEVYQGTVDTGHTESQRESFYGIATQLNALAGQHPFGA